jgi:hypothetical protein
MHIGHSRPFDAHRVAETASAQPLETAASSRR